MSTRLVKMCGCIVILMAGVSFAQDAPPEQKPDGRRGKHKQRGHEERNPERALLKAAAEKLGLDDQQKEAFRSQLKEYGEAKRELHQSVRQSPEILKRLQEIRIAMKDARAADDQAELERLRGELGNIRQERNEAMGPMRERAELLKKDLHDKLLAELRNDQRAAFETIWKEKMMRDEMRFGPTRTPRVLRSIVLKLGDLTEEQKLQLDGLFKAQRDDSREPRDDPKGRDASIKKLYDDVFALLTPEQKAQVEKKLQGQGRRDREGRGHGRHRKGRNPLHAGPGGESEKPQSPAPEPGNEN